MQFDENGSLAHVHRRSRERKGLEAIFSSPEPGRDREILAGAAGIIAGLFLSILAIFRPHTPQDLGPLANAVYSSLTFGALGVLLLICGGGTITYAIAQRESNLSKRIVPTLAGHSDVDAFEEHVGHSETQRMFGAGIKMGVVAFIQSLVLLVLYSSFVQEFESNLTMQIWVQSNFAVGQSVLNWEGVLILSFFLSFLLLQFLPGQFFS